MAAIIAAIDETPIMVGAFLVDRRFLQKVEVLRSYPAGARRFRARCASGAGGGMSLIGWRDLDVLVKFDRSYVEVQL
jgi:hypothetical protein